MEKRNFPFSLQESSNKKIKGGPSERYFNIDITSNTGKNLYKYSKPSSPSEINRSRTNRKTYDSEFTQNNPRLSPFRKERLDYSAYLNTTTTQKSNSRKICYITTQNLQSDDSTFDDISESSLYLPSQVLSYQPINLATKSKSSDPKKLPPKEYDYKTTNQRNNICKDNPHQRKERNSFIPVNPDFSDDSSLYQIDNRYNLQTQNPHYPRLSFMTSSDLMSFSEDIRPSRSENRRSIKKHRNYYENESSSELFHEDLYEQTYRNPKRHQQIRRIEYFDQFDDDSSEIFEIRPKSNKNDRLAQSQRPKRSSSAKNHRNNDSLYEEPNIEQSIHKHRIKSRKTHNRKPVLVGKYANADDLIDFESEDIIYSTVNVYGERKQKLSNITIQPFVATLPKVPYYDSSNFSKQNKKYDESDIIEPYQPKPVNTANSSITSNRNQSNKTESKSENERSNNESQFNTKQDIQSNKNKSTIQEQIKPTDPEIKEEAIILENNEITPTNSEIKEKEITLNETKEDQNNESKDIVKDKSQETINITIEIDNDNNSTQNINTNLNDEIEEEEDSASGTVPWVIDVDSPEYLALVAKSQEISQNPFEPSEESNNDNSNNEDDNPEKTDPTNLENTERIQNENDSENNKEDHHTSENDSNKDESTKEDHQDNESHEEQQNNEKDTNSEDNKEDESIQDESSKDENNNEQDDNLHNEEQQNNRDVSHDNEISLGGQNSESDSYQSTKDQMEMAISLMGNDEKKDYEDSENDFSQNQLAENDDLNESDRALNKSSSKSDSNGES